MLVKKWWSVRPIGTGATLQVYIWSVPTSNRNFFRFFSWPRPVEESEPGSAHLTTVISTEAERSSQTMSEPNPQA